MPRAPLFRGESDIMQLSGRLSKHISERFQLCCRSLPDFADCTGERLTRLQLVAWLSQRLVKAVQRCKMPPALVQSKATVLSGT